MPDTYNIYFSGEIAEGESLDEVRRKVGALFNARDATLDKLFSGKTQLIKRNCSEEEARKYQSAMQRAGALARMTPSDAAATVADGASGGHTPAPASAADVRSAAPKKPEPQAPQSASLTLTPAGTEMLLPTERQALAPRDIDVSALSVAPAGERLGTPTPEAPPAPDTSHITAAAIGEAIPTLKAAAPPPPPDTSGLSLAAPDADLLDERYRQQDATPAPGTDHLSVEPRSHD